MSQYSTQQVHAPYHFVPLSKWVYMPDWAHLVSHDHPFEDGLSGVIDYTLSNKTPLCVGAEQEKDRNGISVVKWAKDPSGKPVIPGSSLKGMLRSVLEIASFGKFSAIDDNHFSFRDISNAKTTYAKQLHESKAQAYWLKFDNEKQQWTLDKTEHTVLFHAEFNKIADSKISNLKHGYSSVNSFKKYPLGFKIYFEKEKKEMPSIFKKNFIVEHATKLNKAAGTIQGYPVFSSFRPLIIPIDMDGEKVNKGKKPKLKELSDKEIKLLKNRTDFSYVFYNEENDPRTFSNSDQMVQKLFANHDKALVSLLKRDPHPTLGIPVFAREVNNKIIALGFAKMPRKLYDKSVKETAKQTQNFVDSNNIFDLAELMLGTLREKGLSLKSRISFTDATSIINKGLMTSPASILGAPQASYLSAYLEQKADKNNIVANELNQYDKQSTLKGWKRYPAQSGFKTHLPKDVADKINVQSRLEMLKEGSQFKGKIVFHNLKQVELGALLWILQFKTEEIEGQHSLGHGKPLGAGAVSFSELTLTASTNNSSEVPDITQLIDCFTSSMNSEHPAADENSWQKSTQVRHLLAFSNQQDNQNKKLNYMPLQTPRGENTISYTSSVKGREKRVLPDWETNGESLSRNEQVSTINPSSFGRGRLHNLISHAQSNRELSATEEKILKDAQTKAAEQKEKQEKAEKMAKLTPCMQLIVELEEQLKQQDQSARPPLIRALMATFLEDGNNFEADSADKLYKLARTFEYHKKPKKRAKEQKAELATLVDKYKLKIQ